MIREKKAKAGTAVIVLVLGMLLLLFVAAENLSQDTGGVTILPAENEMMERENVSGAIPEIINGTLTSPFENGSFSEPAETNTLPETTGENSITGAETISFIDEVASPSSHHNYDSHIVGYTIGQDGNITYLYPNMLIDELYFTSLSGSPTIIELGRMENEGQTFITTFVIDTTTATFTTGSFTKRVEGKELYLCTKWGSGCLANWTKVRDLSGEEYTFPIQSGKIAYGETIGETFLPSLFGINSGLGILSAISPTQADGLIAYGELNIAIPRFRTWNSSNNFSAEQNALSLGVAGTADITWVVTRGNHERDEIIMGTEDKSNDINIQVYNSTAAAWGAQLEVSTDVLNSNSRAFDIAIEDISGEALIVYENLSTADTVISYRIWNGSRYSDQNTLVTGLPSSQIRWVSLTPRRGSDDIMLLIHDNAADLHAFPWNGTAFDTPAKNMTLSTATGSNLVPHFAFAWEESSGQGLAVYAGGTNLVYRTYSPTAPHWSTEATIALGNALSATRLCSDPTSDYIGIIVQDGGNDVNVRMWDGTQILASPPTEDIDTEPSGANNVNLDCAWYNSNTALFGFIDLSSLSVDYFNFTKTNTWSISDLTIAPTTGNFASDDIDGLRFRAHPTTTEIMVTAMDILEDITLLRWNESGFFGIGESPIETSTEVLTAAQEAVMFDWYRYDPVPNVTALNPSGLNFNANAVIDINATIFDNIKMDVVLANITLPNSTIRQITLTNRSGNSTHYNSSFSVTDRQGTYTIRIIANDTSVHQNINSSQTATFTVGDAIAPNVTNVTPASPLTPISFSLNAVVNITANVSDETGLSAVLANVTLPNGTISQVTLGNSTRNHFNITFSVTGTVGTYTVRIIANDTASNLNSTETITFTIGDTIVPAVSNLNPNGENFNVNAVIDINATVTDDVLVGTVLANITLPNSSISQIMLSNRSGNNTHYNSSFSVTNLVGTYTLHIIANDTTNNRNGSQTTTFSVGDAIAPNITLFAPINRSNHSRTDIVFNFTVTDNVAATLNCSIAVNGTVNQTNTSVLNNTVTLFNISGFLERDYQWNVSCNDSSGNTNASILRHLAIDLTAPQFNTLTTSPGAAADLDPNVNVTVLANVTDNRTAVHSVIFQYKLTNDTEYTNVTMAFFSGSGLYNTSFNATRNGTYDLRVWANDTVGNNDFSNTANILVEQDRNWTRTPSTFTAIVSNASLNVTVGNLTINNSGDVSLSFNITSTSSTIRYNGTENFTLAAGGTRVLQINDTAPAGGLKTITLNISVNDSLAVPRSLTAAGSIVVAPGQPVLVATITTPATETRSVTQGDMGVAFTATLENIGEGNATNVTFFFTVPSAWTITFGQTNVTLSTLNSGESTENNIEVTIPADATTGIFTVVANSTGVNAPGADLGNASLIFGDAVSVTISAAAGVLGGATTAGGGGGEAAAAGAAAGGGSGGAAGIVSKTTSGKLKQTIETTEVFQVPRGSGASTPLTITNLWENAYLKNIQLHVSGFLSQYIVISPELNRHTVAEITARPQQAQTFSLPSIGTHTLAVEEIQVGKVTITIASEPQTIDLKTTQLRYLDLDQDHIGDLALELVEIIGQEATIKAYGVKDFSRSTLAYGDTLNYSLDIYAPPYLVQKDYELELKIDALLVPTNVTAAGFTEKAITELRTLLFRIQEIGGEDAGARLDRAREYLQDMVAAEFNTEAAQSLLAQAEQAFQEGDYNHVAEMAAHIEALHAQAFAAYKIIQQVREAIERSQQKWLTTPQTNEALQLALLAFGRGDYTTALERAKNAQLIHVLETKGRVNLLQFIISWWWALALGGFALSILSYFIYKASFIKIVEQRVKNLDKEESTLLELLEEAQKKYLIDKSLSETQYKHYTEQYEQRLTKIRQIRVKLRNKKVALLKTEQGLKSVQQEKQGMQELLRQDQVEYLVKGKISQGKFVDLVEKHKARLAEIEQEEAVLQEKFGRQAGLKRWRLFTLMSRIRERCRERFRKCKLRKNARERTIPKPKQETPKSGPYAGKWVVIKIPEKKSAVTEQNTVNGTKPKENSKITNFSKRGNKAERMTEAELRKKFPGVFT